MHNHILYRLVDTNLQEQQALSAVNISQTRQTDLTCSNVLKSPQGLNEHFCDKCVYDTGRGHVVDIFKFLCWSALIALEYE